MSGGLFQIVFGFSRLFENCWQFCFGKFSLLSVFCFRLFCFVLGDDGGVFNLC